MNGARIPSPRLRLRTTDGWVDWIDGSPPVLFVSDSDTITADFVDPQPPSVGLPRPVFSLRLVSALPAVEPAVVADRFLRRGCSQLHVIGPRDTLPSIELLRWISELRLRFRGSSADRNVRFDLELSCRGFDSSVRGFCLDNPGMVRVIAHDRRSCAEESFRLMDYAAELAVQGNFVTAEVALNTSDESKWREAAEQWRVACNGRSPSFVRPRVADLRSDTRLPDSLVVADFLRWIYDDTRFDLQEVYPISSMLAALAFGTNQLPRCGSEHCEAIDAYGRGLHCDHGCVTRIATNPDCGGKWAPICRVFCALCPGEAALVVHADLQNYARLFCDSVGALMPMLMAEIAATARFAHYSRTRSGAERFRIAQRDGKPVVWSDDVITDHRNRFEGDAHGDGTPHDLSWVRSRPARDRAAATDGRDGSAPAP